MEQINSFLQPLRGILKSGTTKVRCSIFLSFLFITEDGNCNALDRSICSRMECSEKGSSLKIGVRSDDI
jgi:hypothetical protein